METDREVECVDTEPPGGAPRTAGPGALGLSLARAAHRLVARRMPALRWLAALEPVIDRVTSLPVPAGERFRRTPAPVGFASVRPPEAVEVPSWDEPAGEPVPAGLRTRLREVVGSGTEAARRMPALRWLAALEPVIDRVTSLPVPAGERFRRTPAPVGFASVGPPASVEVPSWDEPDDEPLPAGLRTRLREVVGPGTEAVRLHTSDRAAAVAGAAGADALSVGRHVFLGRGRRGGDDEAFALLSHETEHVLRGLRPAPPGSAPPRPAPSRKNERPSAASAPRGSPSAATPSPPPQPSLPGPPQPSASLPRQLGHRRPSPGRPCPPARPPPRCGPWPHPSTERWLTPPPPRLQPPTSRR